MKHKTFNRLNRKAKTWKHIIANHIFVDCLNERSLDETIKMIELYSGVIRKYRTFLGYCMQATYNEHKWAYEPDLRTGDETYGYESLEKIKGDLNYISDRFAAEFRLTWLLQVPEKVSMLKAIV